MSHHPRWRRHAVALWAGILSAWGSVLWVVYIRFRERFLLILLVSAVFVLLGGGLGTKRIRKKDVDTLITVDDLRRH